MKLLWRFSMIVLFFITSTIVIHTMKAPSKLPLQGFRVACMPVAQAATSDADKHLIPYAQIAHTTNENLRCYFRFAAKDVVCTPKSVASRQPHSSCPKFPTIDGTPHKFCYILNKKYIPLSEELKKKPAVSFKLYTTNKNTGFQTWQQIRDSLLGKE